MHNSMGVASARRAVIIGGSMAGLFAGLFLRRAGWQVDVFERTPGPLSARGAGIMTHPELRAALSALGIDTGPGFGVPIATRVLLGADDCVIATHPCAQIATSWTHVHAMLAACFPTASYHAGADLVGVAEDAHSVSARFADGRVVTGDLLIGADGVRSRVRRHLHPDLAPAYAGYVAWRGLLPEVALDDGPDYARASLFSFCLPPGEHMLGYPIAGPGGDLTPGRRHYNFVWYRPADATRDLPTLLTDTHGVQHAFSIPPHAIAPAVTAAMRADASRILAPWFRHVVARTPQPFLQPIYDLAVPSMAMGRIALIGDAAFVVRPHVGGGVVKAADDARILAAVLSDPTPAVPEALRAFSRLREPIGHRMIAQARRLGSDLNRRHRTAAERAAAVRHATPEIVLAETAVLDFLQRPIDG